jgi:tight adherence protein B
MVALSAIVAACAHMLSVALPLALTLGFLAGVLCPSMLLVAHRSRRLKQLEEQLPEAVDVMVRSLRAGHPIPIAIAMVGREMPDPIGSEFGMVSDEMTYGLDLSTAMGNLRERTGQMDIALLVVAISIQSRTGGNLAELLSNLGGMIRQRYRVRRKIRALSAEGRFSSIALSLVPVVVYLVVRALAPSYYGDVQHDALYMPAVYLGITLWVTGVITIRRMVNFKI